MHYSQQVRSFLASRWFFYGALILFVLQTTWLVYSAAYPMAFDEDFHFGIIQIYAGQWLPFLSHHPEGADVFGAVTRDPSYLYHYLMSFPYRFIQVFTDSQTTAIIVLRFINVGLFAGGLVLWRRVMLQSGVSRAATHVVICLFTLIPIVPLLAAQINYDNLLIVLMAWLCLLVLSIMRSMQKKRIPLVACGVLVAVGVYGSLVKYAFLPIIASAVVGITAYGLWLQYKRRLSLASYVGRTGRPRITLTVLAVIIIVGLGLAGERYGINTVRHGDPIPDCGSVLTVEQCKHYGPWGRDYQLTQTKGEVDGNPIAYSKRWLYAMWYRLFFMVNGRSTPSAEYQTYPPLPVLGYTAMGLAAMGLAAVIAGWRWWTRRPILVFFTCTSILYSAVLWQQNYAMYVKTGQAVAINGRYLLIILLPAAAVAITALARLLVRLPVVKNVLAVAAIIIFLQGGLVSFIVRSNDAWYWPNGSVYSVNHAAQRLLRPLVPGQQTVNPLPQP